MNIVEYALEQVKDGALPVERNINCYEMSVLKKISEEVAQKMPGGLEGNLIFQAIGYAYNYGFWQGWKHCEVERPEIDEIAVDEDPDGSQDAGSKKEETA